MSYSDCVARISTIDSLVRGFDPSWRSALPNSSSMSGVQALNANSPFAGVLQTVSSASSTTAAANAAPVNVLSSSELANVPDTLLAPSLENPRELVRVSSTEALAHFDAVASQIPYAAEIRKAALDNGIDPLLLVGLVRWESNFHLHAKSRAGAMGLTQLMPGTAREIGVKDPWDAAQNLDGGAYYLATQLKRFGRVDMAVASYNAGPGCVSRLGKVPDNKWPYVNRILRTWKQWQVVTA
jgi:soluble lytic murein transglycosylase-like protein